MQDSKPSGLSQTEVVSLKRLAAGAPHSSISSDHFGRFRKLMLIQRHGSAWKLTPVGLHQLQDAPKAARITSANPLALLESTVTKQQTLRQHRGLVASARQPIRATALSAFQAGSSLVPAALEERRYRPLEADRQEPAANRRAICAPVRDAHHATRCALEEGHFDRIVNSWKSKWRAPW
jgi:hypothetical protein